MYVLHIRNMSGSFSICAEGIQNLSPVSDRGLDHDMPDWSSELVTRSESTAYLRDDFLSQARQQLANRITEGIQIERERLGGNEPKDPVTELIIDNEIAFGSSLRGIPPELVSPLRREMIKLFILHRSLPESVDCQ